MKYLPFFLIALLSLPVQAEEHTQHDQQGLMPAKTQDISVRESAPTVNLSMDRSELVRLEKDAASIVVGNPAHATVLMDSPRLLVIVPQAPGATHFTVLDGNGDIIMQRHVIVAAPQENYIRVRASYCGEDAEECVKTQSYYCETEGMCHEISAMADDSSTDSNSGNDDQKNAQNQQANPANYGEEPR